MLLCTCLLVLTSVAWTMNLCLARLPEPLSTNSAPMIHVDVNPPLSRAGKKLSTITALAGFLWMLHLEVHVHVYRIRFRGDFKADWALLLVDHSVVLLCFGTWTEYTVTPQALGIFHAVDHQIFFFVTHIPWFAICKRTAACLKK